MKVEKIDHIHILVKDLEAAAKFLSNLMGSQFFGPRESPNDKVAFDNLGFELMQPPTSTNPDNPVSKHLKEHGEGVAWIGLKVPNLDEAVAELRSKGIPIKYWRDYTDPTWKGDIKAAYTQDTSKTYGVVLELVEYQDALPVLMANYNKIGEIPRI